MKEAEYQKALQREAYREIHWRNTQQGAFEFSFGSLDEFTERFDKPDKIAAFSDKGKGIERMIREIDGEERDVSHYSRCVKRARQRLCRHHRELLEVFNLVIKNGSDRKKSARELSLNRTKKWAVVKDRYWTHLKKILDFFKA